MSVVIRQLEPADVASLQDLLESVPQFAEQMTGYLPGAADALSALISVPADFDPAGKRAVGLWDHAQLLAFADVLLGYRNRDTAYIGMMAVRAGHQRIGLGRRLHDAVVAFVRDESSAVQTRLGIVGTNAAVSEPFVYALGYESTGDSQPYRYDKLTSTITHWERSIPALEKAVSAGT